jgi:hypothetical protein
MRSRNHVHVRQWLNGDARGGLPLRYPVANPLSRFGFRLLQSFVGPKHKGWEPCGSNLPRSATVRDKDLIARKAPLEDCGPSGADDYLKSVRLCRPSERVISIYNLVEREVVCDEAGRFNLSRCHGLQQHGSGNGIHEPCGDADIG